jgi:predicted O-linked N-acetylglucosamine transferase (SPINDLY family)
MSLLDELGLHEFAARDDADFINKIVHLQSRIDHLIHLRQFLPELVAASHICRTDLRVRHFERLYKAMCQGFGRGIKA